LQNVRYLCARQQSYRCSAPTSRARVKPAARARWLQHLQLRYVCAYNTYVHRVAARQITLDTVTSTLGSALLGPFPSLPHGIPQLFSGGEHACRSRTSGMLARFFRESGTLENKESIPFSPNVQYCLGRNALRQTSSMYCSAPFCTRWIPRQRCSGARKVSTLRHR
jgi:hypothetical protein